MRGTASDELAVIAQRAQAFTNASGTAIALSEGGMDEIICRARSGASAPEVGTAMRVEGSFTGLCIQSGKELRCDDAETDTRVDTAAIRSLGIRSMVVTPIKDENRVVGVLAVFAPTPHAFTITHVAVLKTMADQISMLLQKERRMREEGHHAEPARPAAPPTVAKPVAVPPAVPSPVVIKPAAPAPSRAAFPVVSKVEPIKTTVMAEEVATPAALPRREERRTDHRAEHRPMFGVSDTAGAEDKKSGISMILVGVAAVAVIAAVSTFAFLKLRKPGLQASVQNAQTIPNTSPAAPVQPVVPAPAATGNTQPSPVSTASAPAPKPAADTSSSENVRKPERSQAKTNPPAQPERRAPETVQIPEGPSRIRTDAGQPSADATPAFVAGNSVPGALSALASSSASSKPSMMTQSELEPVQVLRKVAPVYPIIAKQRRISGSVVVEGQVGKDGRISGLQFLSGPPVFRDAAFDAVKQWQFKPAKLNGQPIEQNTKIRLDFGPS
jgi:TonB family protein